MADRFKLKERVKILRDPIPLVINILAAASLLGLIVQPGWWLYQTAFEDVAAIVTPICERYVFGQANGSTARYLGVNIHAVKPLLNARVRFSDTLSVVQWGLYSDGLSDSETQSFLSELPQGNLLNPFLTPPLPALSAETSTTLTMIALAADEECRGRDPYWVEVTTSQGDVYHINPNVTQIREFPSLFLEAHWAMVVAYLVLFVIITVVLWRYTNRRMGHGTDGT